MFAKIAFALCAISLAYAEFSAKEKEELSVKLVQIKRSVDFTRKIAKIALEMEVFTIKAAEINAAKDDQAKECIKSVTDKAVEDENEVLDSTVGKAQPEINSLYEVVMSGSTQDSDWNDIKNFLDSFDIEQYKKDSKKEFMTKQQTWLTAQQEEMKACLKE